MKRIILAFILAIAFASPSMAETKKFCHTYTQHNKKTNVCKTVNIHKKVDGKPITRKRVK